MNASPSPRRFTRHAVRAVITILLLSLMSGCVLPIRTEHRESTSVVQFLYPGENQPFILPETPTLRLPLRVGIAFAPGHENHGYGGAMFSEARKTEIMRAVAAQFRGLPFVQSIEILPTTYLRPGGGFENLDQLQAMMGIDVIALIAFDQKQALNDDEWSFTYWTIVGAYIVPATKNETHTLMEAVVYDIRSRSLLFRAPGVSAVKGHTTLVGSAERLQDASKRGFDEAATDLTQNLQAELDLFKVRIREEPASVRIEHKSGYTGAGAVEVWFALAVVALAAAGVGANRLSRAAQRWSAKRRR